MTSYIRLSALILLFCSYLTLSANMSSPYIRRCNPSIDLQSSEIHIESENLAITLMDSAKYALYKVEYQVLNPTTKSELLLVFDCATNYSEFQVWLDGTACQLIQLDDNTGVSFANDSSYDQGQLAAFKLNLNKGKHTIEVSYKGYPEIFLGSLLMRYTFRYNLAPARSWKSFEHLNLSIDATAFAGKDVTVDIGNKTYPLGGIVQSWQFNSIPQDYIEIKFNPPSNIPFTIDPSWFFWLPLLVGAFFNIRWIKRWRLNHPNKKLSNPAMIGALVVPAIVIVCYRYSFPLIDLLIGHYASGHHGYLFFIFLGYPFLAIFYFFVAWLIDFNYKMKLRAKDAGNVH